MEVHEENKILRGALESLAKQKPEDYWSDYEYWESGNFDECYDYGVETGINSMAEQAERALKLIYG